jgi:DNA polymerase-3 subunit beta
LSRALSERVLLLDYTIGRRGLLGYLKALAGSNIIKIVPASDGASETQTVGKRLKVTCGSNTSYLEDSAWIGDKTPMTLCEVRISPNRTVKPNIGGLELSEALNRVLPFTAKEDNRPVLQCVLFKAGEGKLTLVSADGFRLAMVTLDYDGEGEALILRDDLKGIANALRRAHRVNLSFEASGESLDGMSLVIDTEITRYKWRGADGTFPDYEKLIPAEANITAHLDTVEAVKAIASLKVLADSKSYPIDLHLNGGVVMSCPDDKGQFTMPADIEGGEVSVRIDGGYLSEALRACGGMVDFKVTDGKSPVLFAVDGYQLVVMPMLTADSQKPEPQAENTEPTAEPEPEADGTEPVTEPEAEAEAVVKAEKPKRSRKKEPVAVA